jgi:hypothetical protein
MKYYIIVAVIVLIGFFWVKRLSGLIYNNEQYTQALNRRYHYDDVLDEENKMDDDQENS